MFFFVFGVCNLIGIKVFSKFLGKEVLRVFRSVIWSGRGVYIWVGELLERGR